MREIRNAIIESTMLGPEDHGILSCWLHLKYDGGGQGFGGYALDAPRFKGLDRREFIGRFGTAYGMEFIRRILKVVGVERWEELPGKHIRVDAAQGKVYRVGHIINDKWFDPENDLKNFVEEASRCYA